MQTLHNHNEHVTRFKKMKKKKEEKNNTLRN